MRRRIDSKGAVRKAGILLSVCVLLGADPGMEGLAAEQDVPYFAEDGLTAADGLAAEDGLTAAESFGLEDGADAALEAGSAQSGLTGDYSVDGNWVAVGSESEDGTQVYKISGNESAESTSVITCSYLDTNYSVFEYEQLRDMLTNNLVYKDVDAQISTSAVYTDAKDYLFILVSDDAARDYRDIYCYVVGDMRCFCVSVKEYRAEAEQMSASEETTPEEAGKKIAQGFVWNTAG